MSTPIMAKKSDSKSEDGEDEIFNHSSFLAHFENTSFKDSSRFSGSAFNESFNTSNNAMIVSALCCDEEFSGYDKLTGKTWIYPTNYPVRDYQYNIIRAAILKNTLVSLPTGLGKTFIAAVIMYNFYRWYPLGKIVFTAPTRPLVAQQIDACYNIIAIPPDDTIEMTGHMAVNTRKIHWQTKRVFFATPQVIYNDIKSGICPGEKIRCLVIDEAHRARGNYAYCQIVSTLTDMKHRTYRVLALSATPGSKVDDVINVIKNLHIAHLELRTENCIDVARYSHVKKINTVVVQLGPELSQLRQHYIEILDEYARRLKQLNILPQNLGNLSKGRVVMLYKEFQSRDRGARHPQHNYIMKDFTLLIALFHGLELLVKHGSRVFLNFFDEHPEKAWIQADDRLTALLERLRDDLGINPMSLDRSILPDGTIPDIPKNICFGHPKFDKLKEIMVDHFNKAKLKNQDTRAIVFCEYRESVNLVHCLLLQCRPLITPQMFVGQGASGKDGKAVISQKQQLRVMRSFRGGGCNALVATCVAEEGLDVGSVDLILCFDISNTSPIRLVQRCGRTGRERGGQVYILVTEGREHQTLLDCMRQRDGLNKKIQQSKEVETNLFKSNPRMMPYDVTPVCQKMFITVAKKEDPKDKAKVTEKGKKGQKDLRSMIAGSSNTSNKNGNSELITEDEFQELFPTGYEDFDRLPGSKEYMFIDKASLKQNSTEENNKIKLWNRLEYQRTMQKTIKIGHSKDTRILTELLQYSDAKRFEMPASTQNPSFCTQELPAQNFVMANPGKPKPVKKKTKAPVKSPTKKSGDIRALFSTATKSTKSYTKLINELGIKDDGIPTSIINVLVDLSLDNNNVRTECYICQNICDCKFIDDMRKHKRKASTFIAFLKNPVLPDIDLIDGFDADSILKCEKVVDKSLDLFDESSYSKPVPSTSKQNCSNFDLEFDFDSPTDVIAEDNNDVMQNSEKNFDIGDIEDIFADSSPEEAVVKEDVVDVKNSSNPKEVVLKEDVVDVKNTTNPKEALGFFGLDSIDDIFADSDDSKQETPEKCNRNNENNNTSDQSNKEEKHEKQIETNQNTKRDGAVSPSILSGQLKTSKIYESPTSPILCTQARKFKLSTKKVEPKSSTPVNVRRQLIPDTGKSLNKTVPDHSNQAKCNSKHDTSPNATNKSMFTITQLVDMINRTDKSITTANVSNNESTSVKDDERSTSPILLTQAVRKKNKETVVKRISNDTLDNKVESLIILDSDSDDDFNDATQVYDIDEENSVALNVDVHSPLSAKRKLEDDETMNASPYFGKRLKLDNRDKPLTLQEKVLAALNKTNKVPDKNDTSINFMIASQKENENPNLDKSCFSPKNDKDDDGKCIVRKNLEMLQMFRRDSPVNNPKRLFDASPKKTSQKRKNISFDDSDDDFVGDDKIKSQKPAGSSDKHKVRKVSIFN